MHGPIGIGPEWFRTPAQLHWMLLRGNYEFRIAFSVLFATLEKS